MTEKTSRETRSAAGFGDYLLEVLKIVNGALSADVDKVVTYTEMLAERLEVHGEARGAERLRKALRGAGRSTLAGARLSDLSRIPVDSESRLPLADEERLEPGSVPIFLDSEPQELLDEFMRYTRAAGKLIANGVGIAPSLLAFGPPGCGKTELARFVAAELQLPLLTARSDSLISSYLGSTAKNVRLLFESAMSQPCVLFLDEFDALAKKRDDVNELGELKRVVISLLQNLDALDGKTVVVAATNHEHLLDPAVWRRFSYRILIDRPSPQVRNQLFERYLGDLSEPKELETYAKAADGLTGAEIREVSSNTIREAVVDGKTGVSEASVLTRILRIRLGKSFSGEASSEGLAAVRALDSRLFTYRRLASVFGISLGTVSKLLKNYGGSDETALTDQGC